MMKELPTPPVFQSLIALGTRTIVVYEPNAFVDPRALDVGDRSVRSHLPIADCGRAPLLWKDTVLYGLLCVIILMSVLLSVWTAG